LEAIDTLCKFKCRERSSCWPDPVEACSGVRVAVAAIRCVTGVTDTVGDVTTAMSADY
jgi:hypothetical protein